MRLKVPCLNDTVSIEAHQKHTATLVAAVGTSQSFNKPWLALLKVCDTTGKSSTTFSSENFNLRCMRTSSGSMAIIPSASGSAALCTRTLALKIPTNIFQVPDTGRKWSLLRITQVCKWATCIHTMHYFHVYMHKADRTISIMQHQDVQVLTWLPLSLRDIRLLVNWLELWRSERKRISSGLCFRWCASLSICSFKSITDACSSLAFPIAQACCSRIIST